MAKTSLPTISLDDRYVVSASNFIGISRGVDKQLNDTGYVSRVGYDTIASQLATIAAAGREVTIVDDVLFSGEMISWLSNELARRNVKIGSVICGIAIKEGIDKLQALGIDTQAVYAYDEVEDELCERDFAVVPGSGRRIAQQELNALYFNPVYGRPSAWASLPPDGVNAFARASFLRSANILQPTVQLADIGEFYGLKPGDARSMLQWTAGQIEKGLYR